MTKGIILVLPAIRGASLMDRISPIINQDPATRNGFIAARKKRLRNFSIVYG